MTGIQNPRSPELRDSMVMPAELEQLERDFLSGRNPLAYIPLCQGLRRQKSFTRALDLCRRGLAMDQESLAGRTLHARLLADLGRYEEALTEIARAEKLAPDSSGLLSEKARSLIYLHRFDEARAIIISLQQKNLMGVDVQVLADLLRQRERNSPSLASERSSAENNVRSWSNKVILEGILKELRPLANIKSAAIIPIGAGEPALEGSPTEAEAAYEHYKGIQAACNDLESGQMRLGFIETSQCQLIVLVRQKALVSVSFDPTPNFGKIYHRLPAIASRYLPEISAG